MLYTTLWQVSWVYLFFFKHNIVPYRGASWLAVPIHMYLPSDTLLWNTTQQWWLLCPQFDFPSPIIPSDHILILCTILKFSRITAVIYNSQIQNLWKTLWHTSRLLDLTSIFILKCHTKAYKPQTIEVQLSHYFTIQCSLYFTTLYFKTTLITAYYYYYYYYYY